MRFDVIADEHNANRLYLYECYADLAAREAHGQGESIALFRAATTGWAEASTVLGRGNSIFPTDDHA